MAEFVTETQERLMPQYEQLKRLEILSDEQLRQCIRQRESLQMKIAQPVKSIVNYLEYIAYELKLHKLVTEKEKVLGVNAAGLKAAIATRIIQLYREGLRKFPEKLPLWEHFIKFSKKSVPHEVAGIYEKMLTYHGEKPKYWIDAAIWTYEYSHHMARVRDIFLRGLQRHVASEDLNKCFFDVLLNETSSMRAQRELDNNSISEQEIGLERVEAVYRNSAKHIKNIEYYIKVLERCEETKYADITAKLQRTIVDDMKVMFPRNELLWDTLAQRELRGFSINDLEDLEKTQVENAEKEGKALDGDVDVEQTDDSGMEHNQPKHSIWKKRTLARRIELCCSVYQQAVSTLKTERMWTLYIEAMLELNQDLTTQPNLKRKSLGEAFKAGHESQLMSLELYTIYRNLLLESPNGNEMAARLLREAIVYKKTVPFYELLLQVYISERDEPKVYELFKRAQKIFGTDAYPIWQQTIDFYKSEDTNKLERIYEEGLTISSANFIPLRCDYLDFCMQRGGITKAREAYAELRKLPPQSLQLHQKMAEFESKQALKCAEDKKHLRRCYEYMACYFGTTNPQVWLDFVRFEREHGDCKLITNLFQRAKSALPPKALERFMVEFQLEHSI